MSKKSIQHVDDKAKGSRKLSFSGLKPNIHLLHLSVLRQLASKRAGTASTKTKSEVRGGGKKPWRQKGTGRARVGSVRSPLWVGGGIAFGPKPRSYKFKIPQKARNLAIAQALSLKEGSLITLKGLPELKEIKTKKFLAEIKSLGLEKSPVLLVCSSHESYYKEAELASRNVPALVVQDQMFVNVFEILKANSIGITEAALKELTLRFSNLSKSKKGEAA